MDSWKLTVTRAGDPHRGSALLFGTRAIMAARRMTSHADRSSKRELALCRRADGVRLYRNRHRQPVVLQPSRDRRRAVGTGVRGDLRGLDLLSARITAADIAQRPEG